MRRFALLIYIAIALTLVVALRWWFSASDQGSAFVDVKLPQLSAQAAAGAMVFAENCATCHGENASGTDQGPPLIHIIYEPNHHADESIRLAVKNGVRAHHWPYGDMAPVEGVAAAQIEPLITFIREVQRHNGIH